MRRRRALAGAFVLAAVLALPASASASKAEVQAFAGELFFFSDPGETNDLTVSRSGANYVFTDTGSAITPMAGCTTLTANSVTCDGTEVGGIKVYAGDMNDTVTVASSVVPMPLGSYYSPDVVLAGEDGADTLTGGANVQNGLFGQDEGYVGDVAADTLTGGSLRDELDGGAGADQMTGNGDSDSFRSGPGADTMSGGPGHDQFEGGSDPDGPDVFRGGADIDSIYYDRSAAVNISMNDQPGDGDGCPGPLCENDDVGSDIEYLGTGDGADVVTGSAASEYISTGGGNDSVDAGVGNDNISGSQGDDTLSGGDGNDVITGDEGIDTIMGGAGDDLLGSSFEADEPDSLFGGPGTDLVDYSTANSAVSVSLDNKANDGVVGEADNVHRDIEDVTGSQYADVLTGSGSANQIEGGNGADKLRGLGGLDGLDGGRSADLISGGTGVDTIDGGEGPDRILARDRKPDDVSCGSSVDKGTADRADRLAGDCEKVTKPRGKRHR